MTEALGGGVLHCIALLANAQAASGDQVIVVHSVRPDTPSSDVLDTWFDSRVERRVLPMSTSIGPRDVLALLRVAICLRRLRADVIHLHSSKAGALGRMAARLLGSANRTLYSPHGFAFLRRDISSRRVRLLIGIERILHAIGGPLVACSRSEARYAAMLLSRKRVHVVDNAIDLSRFGEAGDVPERRTAVVCTSGRVAFQKAPWRFAQLAKSLAGRHDVRCTWLGDGAADQVRRWLADAPVEQSGWIAPDAMRDALARSDVYVLPSLWEGMPIALIEAQAMGLPAVASRIVGNRDIVEHGVTGFLVDNDDELLHYTELLLQDAALRRRMGEAARARTFLRFGAARFVRGFDALYDAAGGRRASRAPLRRGWREETP
ncbi:MULTISPECIES: glycosyltransferase [unclassified Burkholderia]|uniref:glycosyltransferase n=1 Tax=unclassified Burkholderia TaxID=2613784 RepID=UPI0015C66B2C|nr:MULTISPECIES: glycosyltransferase [unclassified Burkholderia]MBN3730516.1 glycosyltransferase family 4 protein [Burkholderia sp. Tr-20390]